MKESGFYLIKESYIDKVNQIGGSYQDRKERPIYCCIEDKQIQGLYWAIPTSDASHRTPNQLDKIVQYCNLPPKDIRSNYYHLADTNRAAIFKISLALPITDQYIDREYISQGQHLVLKDSTQKMAIQRKLLRILAYEGRFPNRLEQHITDLKIFFVKELEQAKNSTLEQRLQNAKQKCEQINAEKPLIKESKAPKQER